ncbi:hypothetical protein PMKS-003863 [Pichia membranifaciens]|uniref:Uncharacterized protein n=1 Tax=Pichia membranifaciens TaxID=4926 RepID=A0A1Q2YLD1_9ASCO|nr:hypothetical protein PMKS-003863 [Pichia membranifaciens]
MKHMKKEELEQLQREQDAKIDNHHDPNNKRAKANSLSTATASTLISAASALSCITSNTSNASSNAAVNNNPIVRTKISPKSTNPYTTNHATSNNKPPLAAKVTKKITPTSHRNSSSATPSLSSSSLVSPTGHISKQFPFPRKRRVSSNNNSLILDQNDQSDNIDSSIDPNANNSNGATRRTSNANVPLSTNITGTVIDNNNIQLPLYPLNDNQLNSIGDYSDISSSLATFEHLNDSDSNFDRFNELQSNAYNYYRRASFSAMSGVNYALTNPEPYASETVEFSTPQFNSLEDEQEKWLNSFSDNNDMNGIEKDQSNPSSLTEIEQLNNFINSKIQKRQQQQDSERTGNLSVQPQRPTQNGSHHLQMKQTSAIRNHSILNGYSFYDDDTMGITESLFKTRLGDFNTPKKVNNPPPFKSNSPIMQDEILNSNINSNKAHNISNNKNSKYIATNNNIDAGITNGLNSTMGNSNYKYTDGVDGGMLQNLFDKISKLGNSLNSNLNINVLDQLNLEQLEQMTHKDESKTGNGNHSEKAEENEKLNLNSDFFDNFFDDNDSGVLEGVTKKVLSWQETLFNQPITDLEKLNEMHIAKAYGVPQGYSFYGGDEAGPMNRSNSNGLLGTYNDGSLSSDATISPVLLEPTCSVGHMDGDDEISKVVADADAMDVDNTDDNLRSDQNLGVHDNANHQHHKNPRPHHSHHRHLSFEEEFSEATLSSYSQAFLFTNNIARLVNRGLSDYPFFGTPTPELLPNDVLNLYVDQFIGKFITHHPFIHRGVLNEYWLMKEAIDAAQENSISIAESESYKGSSLKLVRDENFVENFKVSIICLPLLITTIGAVVSNKREDAAILYEISRRCIHVYLESRKKLRTCGGVDGTSSSASDTESSPLWLIQSLTLSVIYGLFADEEISLSVIIRQVHALNALIKSSGINQLQVPEKINSDYKSFINHESTIRTIHMIFHVSTLLSTLYNIVPSLNISDLNTDLPSASLLWECSSAEEYYKLIENFDFHAKNFKEVIRELVKLDLDQVDSNTGLVDDRNFLLDYHVSEFGLICLQNGLHQLVYFKQLSNEDDPNYQQVNDNVVNIGKCILEDVGEGADITIEKIRKVGEVWNLLVKACVLYNKSSEVYNDCKILNHYLNLKLSSIVSLNKIKESVWLKSFSDINEQYIACFNYGDDELKDQHFQTELIHLIENSINILKLVFFNEDNSLIGTISPSFLLQNETMKKLDDIYATPPPPQLNSSSSEISPEDKEELTNSYNYNSLNKINLNVLHKLSIDSQILFDVILIIVKFLTNYENFFKIRMKFNNLTNYTFLQHFEMSSAIFLSERGEGAGDDNDGVEEALQRFDKVLFKYYLKFFKIFLNLEQFLKHNYNYEDFETGQALQALNNLYPNIKSNNGAAGDGAGEDGDFAGKEIDRVLRESHNKFREEERTLNDIVSDELVVFHDRDLIMSELVNFKLPFKFLKMGGFLFGFIYDKNFKFVNFKHLSDVLFHLRIFLESKDEYV